MAASPLPLSHLQDIAARAVEHLDGVDGQATVLWERRRGTAGDRERLEVTVTVVVDGRAAVATAPGVEDVHLARAAKAASVNARRPRAWPAPPLPVPAAGRGHDGWDPDVLTWTPAEDRLEWEAAAARIAIASTRGIAVAEQRTHARARARTGTRERAVVAAAAAVGPQALDVGVLVAEARSLALDELPLTEPAGGEPVVVLGAQAVAHILDRLRPAFGIHLDLGDSPLAGRTGTRVAAPAVNLSDSARHPGTLPRSYDAEGTPRRPVPLIQDGVAHRRVHDSASAARAGAESTGHASRAAALAAIPEQLVLVGGGAEGIDALCAPVGDGLHIPAIEPGEDGRPRARGAVRIRAGVPAARVPDHPLDIDPLAVLAGVEALDARQRLVALPGHAPGGAGAAVVPALRSRSGVRAAS